MPRNVHYVLSTHWDREWYQPFQDYRYRLVELIDEMMAGWADGRLQGPFQTDGQVIVLEDYLEIRPERRAQVEALVRDGHFVVGPWYVLPDEFLVSGESLIRNIELGRRVARGFGAEPSNAGFLCDMFGHNSQMPQIFAGFGMPMAFIWRGNNLSDSRVVIWRGADGTEIPSYRFGENGYCTYATTVRRVIGTQPPYTVDEIRTRQAAFLKNENAKTETGPLLAFDGGDHLAWDPADYAVLAEHFGKDGEYSVRHSTLDAYMAEMIAQRGQITTRLEGELREPGLFPGSQESQWLIPGVGSSRVNLKLANAACQTLLCQWAEPLNAFAHAALGTEYPQGYLDTAWRWLIQNHPHDSICGCSIDSVHEDMMYRFHQSEQIAERISTETARKVTASVVGELAENEVRVGVFNPLAQALDEVVDLDLEVPQGWPNFNEMSNLESKIALRIFDAEGSELPYQRVSQQRDQPRKRFYGKTFVNIYRVDLVRVSLPLRIPALGYTTLTLRAGEGGRPTRHPDGTGLVTGERSMANEFLSVVIQADGTLTVTDWRSGQVYPGLMSFEDRGDIGDGWNHGPALSDEFFFSPGSRVSIARLSSGRYKASFRIRTVMEVPGEYDFQTMKRSQKMTELVLDSTVSLRAGSERLEVETTVHNTVLDHRLRVLFPSGANAATYLADSPFDVVERAVALREDNYQYREPEIEAKPQQTFTAVFDAQRGLAVMSSGLMESAVVDNEQRTLALTLFRATRQTVDTNGEPGGQMQGELRFRYWLAPLNSGADRAKLLNLGLQLAGGIRQVYQQAGQVRFYRQAGELPAQAGLLRVEGAAVLSSARRSAAGLEVRLFNPETSEIQAHLSLADWPQGLAKPVQATPVNFEHQPAAETMAVVDGAVSVGLGPKQILTLLFQ
jgi:alpha-mannosidase/mannosylglycerate hydrolase